VRVCVSVYRERGGLCVCIYRKRSEREQEK
jgi:hypothetical protein